jgi:hypothetical protein
MQPLQQVICGQQSLCMFDWSLLNPANQVFARIERCELTKINSYLQYPTVVQEEIEVIVQSLLGLAKRNRIEPRLIVRERKSGSNTGWAGRNHPWLSATAGTCSLPAFQSSHLQREALTRPSPP